MRWLVTPRFAPHIERQREAFAAELELQGEPKLAARVRSCCRLRALSGLDCCGSQQRVIVNTCGVRGCPVCSASQAREEADRLWAYARHIEATIPAEERKDYRWRHVVLTSERHVGTLEAQNRRYVRELKRAVKKLWRKLAPFSLGMMPHIEAGSGGMIHAHCLVLSKWIDAPWLKRTWAKVSGWGYFDKENGQRRGVCSVDLVHYYKTPALKKRAKWLLDDADRLELAGRRVEAAKRRAQAKELKSYGATRRALAEVAKYLSSPKAGPVLGARMAVALRDAPRSWSYGCFRGLSKLRDQVEDGCSELLERDRETGEVRRQRVEAKTPEVCPECGTVHPHRKLTPFVDPITSELAFGTCGGFLELLEQQRVRAEARAFVKMETQHKRRKEAA